MTLDPRLRPFRVVVWMFAVLLSVQAATAAVLFVQKLGVSPEAIARFYVGHEDAFAQPKSLAGLMKVTIPHLLAIPLTAFITVHLVGYVGVCRPRPFAVALKLLFAFALLGIFAGYAVRYVAPEFAIVKFAAFIGFESVLLFWLALLVVAFWPVRRMGAASEEDGAVRRNGSAARPPELASSSLSRRAHPPPAS